MTPIKMELCVYIDPDRNGFIDCMSLIKGEMVVMIMMIDVIMMIMMLMIAT